MRTTRLQQLLFSLEDAESLALDLERDADVFTQEKFQVASKETVKILKELKEKLQELL